MKLCELIEQTNSCEVARFAAASLDYLLPPADSLDKLVKMATSTAIQQQDAGVLVRLALNKGPLLPQIIENMAHELGKTSKISILKRFGVLIDILISRFGNDNRAKFDEVEAIRRELVEKIKKRQNVSPFATKLVFDLTYAPDWRYVEQYGLRLWSNGGRRDGRLDSLVRDTFMMSGESIRALRSRFERG